MEIEGWGWLHWPQRPASSVARLVGIEFEVDDARCFGCAACIALCPVDALRLDGLLAIVDEPVCTHCRLCIPACPVHALALTPTEEKNDPTSKDID